MSDAIQNLPCKYILNSGMMTTRLDALNLQDVPKKASFGNQNDQWGPFSINLKSEQVEGQENWWKEPG